MKLPTLFTDRLVLRSFLPSDYHDLYEYLSDPEVVKYEPYEVFTLKQCKAEAKKRACCHSYWAVCLKESGKMIGNLYFSPEDYYSYELGFVFNTNYQKHGYAYESCMALLEYGFHTLHIHRITACCATKNTSSWKLMEHLKMRREGYFLQNIILEDNILGTPIYFDSYEYAILRQEFELIYATSKEHFLL